MGEQDTSSSIEACGLSQPPAGLASLVETAAAQHSTGHAESHRCGQRASHAWKLMQSALNECRRCMLVCAAVLSWSMWHPCEPQGGYWSVN